MPTPTEDKFILHWRALGCERVCSLDDLLGYRKRTGCRLSTWDPFEDEKLIESDGEGEWALTPRGADLLATADAIGYDPAAKPDPTPKMQPCPGCNGVGRKPLGIAHMGADPEHVCELDYTCTTCKGLSEVPALQERPDANAHPVLAFAESLRKDPGYIFREAAPAKEVIISDETYQLPADFLPPMNPKRLRTGSSGNVRLTFGKHSGLPLKKVPSGYLNWVVRESFCKSLVAHCTAELARRDRAK